jgi:DNA-binding transcriptional MerR regulator
MERPLVTVGGAAHLVAQTTGQPCSPDRIRYNAGLGRIPSTRTASGIRLFRPDDVLRFAQTHAEDRRSK